MWEKVKLGEYLNIMSGYAFKSSLFSSDCSDVPLIRIRDIERGFTETFYKGEYSSIYLINKGDLLIGMDGEFNIARWTGAPSLLNQRVCKISVKKIKKLSERYIYHIISKHLKKIEDKTPYVTVKHLSINSIKNIDIHLPPLAIQEKIANILDKADQLRCKDQEMESKYEQLVQAIFIDMFGDPVKNEKGWEMGTIRNIVQEVKYGTSSPAQEGGQFPYLRMNNITYDGYWDFKSLKYINASEDEYNKYGLHYNDLVFNRTNSKELVGKTAVYKGNDKVIIAGYLIRVRVNEKAHPDYIAAFLNSKYGKLTLSNMCKNIVGQANINAQELQDIKIPIPPTHLQEEFSRRIEITNNLKAKNNLEKSEELFQSLLQKAFTGELIQ